MAKSEHEKAKRKIWEKGDLEGYQTKITNSWKNSERASKWAKGLAIGGVVLGATALVLTGPLAGASFAGAKIFCAGLLSWLGALGIYTAAGFGTAAVGGGIAAFGKREKFT